MIAVESRERPPRSAWLWAELELARAACGLGGHPYVAAWREGRLCRDDLRVFAGEQDRVVAATAAAGRRAATGVTGLLHAGLVTVAADVAADVPRWRAFTRAVGGSSEIVLGSTEACERALAGGPRRASSAVVGGLWAVTVAHLDLAPTLAAGLEWHSGIGAADKVWFESRPATIDRLGILEAAIEGTLALGDPYPALLGARATFVALRDWLDALEHDRAMRAQEAVLT